MADMPSSVVDLVERFDRQVDAYRRGALNETQVRVEFIDPLFIALGWDVRNEAGYAEAYKDVVHEDAIKEGAPDYCFRVGGTRKFFLEAKKPAVDIGRGIDPAYQLRRYAWSAKLPLSILTDFEEFAAYDCRVRPKPTDKASAARTLYIQYTEYADRWDEIAGVFSKEAVLQGSFDRYVSGKRKRGTAEVDEEFLRDIERWREALARNLALRNRKLTERELNYAVQRTIDRIIFLRMCEDRGAEDYARLQSLIGGPNVYDRLLQLFREADDRYNSGLFHFRKERGRATPVDELTPGLKIDDKVLKDILKGLYYPQSPYEFSVLPADILGNVYEQFLGKVIRLTAGHQARIEEKPEVRKAGGVYYTPKYIVEHTVGKLVEGKTPQEVGGLTPTFRPSKTARPLTVLDPACGSGSFLMGAYRYLLQWHRDRYVDDGPGNHTARIYQGPGGQWLLTTEEKKRILTSCIYGVDIDPQAVEVTKLNLLLCCLENENQGTMRQLALIHERALPDLGSNIKCGNSLIGTDFYQGQQGELFDDEQRWKINAFDWPDEFPHIFAGEKPGSSRAESRGFDAVIGNPPYVRHELLRDLKPYFSARYSCFDTSADLYVYFLEKGLSLLAPNGLLSFIVSSGFLRTTFADNLRRHLAEEYALLRLVDFGGLPVFAAAKDTYVCIPLLARQTSQDDIEVTEVAELPPSETSRLASIATYSTPRERLAERRWSFDREDARRVFKKITQRGQRLGAFLKGRLFSGIKTGLNRAFVLSAAQAADIVETCPSALDVVHPFAAGEDIRRYALRETGKALIAIPSGWTRSGMQRETPEPSEVAAWRWLTVQIPPVADYLKEFEEPARKRQDQGDYWWELRACDYYQVLEEPKIVYPDIAKGPRFYLDAQGTYIGNTAYALASAEEWLLAILNSRLSWFCVARLSIPFGTRGGRFRYRLIYQYMENFPVPNPPSGEARAAFVTLTRAMQDLRQQGERALSEHDRALLSRQITSTDREIDRLVYELYGLTEEEIRIVEETK